MDTTTMNVTASARHAATVIGKQFFESHRGAVRYGLGDMDEGFCVLLYGNDGFVCPEEYDPVIHAKKMAYVHSLYAGVLYSLPEGCVEFGTDEEGFSWAILAHFPWPEEGSGKGCVAYIGGVTTDGELDADDEDDDDADGSSDSFIEFWDGIVWAKWQSQLAFTEE